MDYKSHFYDVNVRKEITREFTRFDGTIDDMMAGLHEVRARIAEKILPTTIVTPSKKDRVVSTHTGA